MKRLLILALLCIVHSASAQTDRDRALQLYAAGNHIEAFPLLAKLAAADSNDRVVLFRYAFTLLEQARLLPDSAARKAERLHARTVMLRVRTLGETDPLVASFIRAIPPDGGPDVSFSKNGLADAAMQRAEKAFVAGDMPVAIAGYRDALAIDSTLYDAAVFLGDAFNRAKQLDSALTWYHRAIAINPHRETAHRYMADVLVANNRLDEGRDEAIEAIVAEPFNRLSRQGLSQWGRAAKIPGGLPLVDLPPKDTSVHSRAAVVYDSVRRDWRGTPGTRSAAFTRAYPGDTAYRHSVAEETAALTAAAASGDTSLAVRNVRILTDAGELTAFIFFARADRGIADEYAAYARDHHDVLRRFWLDFAIGAKYVK